MATSKPPTKFAEQVGATLADTGARIAHLEAVIERNTPDFPLSPGAELARFKALREHQIIAEAKAGDDQALSRRAGLVPATPPQPEPALPASDAGAGAMAARMRQKRT